MSIKTVQYIKKSHCHDEMIVTFRKTIFDLLLRHPNKIKIFQRTNGIWKIKGSNSTLSKKDTDLISFIIARHL